MSKKQLSPVKYITTKAKILPFHECFISQDWNKRGMASILISKRMPSGNFIAALYLVDVFCLGLKNTLYRFNLSQLEYDELYDQFNQNEDFIPCKLEMAHNIIYGAIDYADELGFAPNSDFKVTEKLLDEDLITDDIDTIELGKDGKPFFIAGPDDNINRIIAILNKKIGEGNYDFLHPGEM